MLVSGRLSPIRSCTGLTLDVEAITATISRIIQPVIAITVLTLPAIMSGSGSLYLCSPSPGCSNLSIAKNRAQRGKLKTICIFPTTFDDLTLKSGREA